MSKYINSEHLCTYAGVDPIQEAILEYNRARQGVALPPDIYLGLRFNDAEGQPTSDVTGAGQVEKLSRLKYQGHIVVPRFRESAGTLNLICPSLCLSVTKTLTLAITFALLQVEL